MVGDHVGGFLLLALLGRGASGAVWRAADPAAPNDRSRDVALKRLSVPDSETDQERLRREAEALAKLRHPNVIGVREVVTDGAGIALVLDLADGGTLADRLRTSGPLAPDEVQRLLGPVADALAAAHRAGLVHRDVKPANVFLTSDGRALLGDFGIAHDAARTQLTRTDLAIGTAAYLDPEVLDGADPGPQSDQYALGITLYEALTGAPPFNGPVPMAVLKAADDGRYEPLDRARHGALANVVERSFNRSPNGRFPDLTTLSKALGDPDGAVAAWPADSDDDPLLDALALTRTTAFRRNVRSATLANAAPVRRSRRPAVVFAVSVGALLAAAGTAFAMRNDDPRALRPPVPHALPTCAAETQPQCVRSFVRRPDGIDVTFADQRTEHYRVGEVNDALRISNWLCGERATLAVYRPSTGTIYYFSAWPDARTAEAIKVAADATGIVNAQALVASDRNADGCADFGLQTETSRTWFLPAEQTGRLAGLPDIDFEQVTP